MNRIAAMEARLSERDKRRLQRVYAPQVIGTHPSNTWADLCVMPDGEIRYYGHDAEGRFYISSTDCGLTWQRRDVDDLSLMASGVLNPHTGRWFSSFYVRGEGGWQNAEMPTVPQGADNWQAVLSDGGPGSPCRWVKVSEGTFLPRLPYVLSTGRVLIASQRPARPEDPQHPVIARSDDNGETWALTELTPAPPHVPGGLHESVRWQNGSCEPTIVERADGSLLLIARTSQDVHYQYESFDGGETWSDPQPTTLHGTLTMPTLLRLSSGALLFFFCNTQPLHEFDKTKVWPPLADFEMKGVGEDVFTNRDANHAAISFDDGRTWRGFREIMLNSLRNTCDFRTSGGNLCNDKSVHQFHAVELPFGKVLLCCGQHEYVRRMVLFDPKWLLETERSENFLYGMESVSTQVYLKSISGNKRPNWNGHCAWNRTDGAVMLPDPDGNHEEALYISTRDDDRLYSPMQGMVWNFPAAKRGTLSLRMMVLEDGLTFTLSDRWFNPIDPHAAACSQFTCAADGAVCTPGQWVDVELHWDETGCDFTVNGALISRLAPQDSAPNGLCYLIAQSAPDYTGRKGAYIKCLSMKAAE